MYVRNKKSHNYIIKYCFQEFWICQSLYRFIIEEMGFLIDIAL